MRCLHCSKETKNPKYCSLSCVNKATNSTKATSFLGEFKDFLVDCKTCDKKFTVREREKKFPKKRKYFCSRSCANTRKHSEETKAKIRASVTENINYSKIKYKFCKICDQRINKYRKYCSKKCMLDDPDYLNRLKEIARLGGLKAGRVSAASQNRRSYNEKYFASLCEHHFDNVLTNEPIFDGWDADVILPDFKIAILWNGIWHYKKITKSHSLKQVQNRDRIKLKKIQQHGYKAYIVKDMGKHDKAFVEAEFSKFLDALCN